MRQGKAPGKDGVNAEMLRAGKVALVPDLVRLFNECIKRRTCPSALAEASTILLPKSGDPHDIGNYRPISLLSNILKLFTRTIGARVGQTLDEAQPPEQAGFRKSFSTVDHIFALKELISRAAEFRFSLYMVFVDFKKAFDCVESNAVLKAIREQGVDPELIAFINSLYANGSSEVRFNESAVKIEIQ